MGRSQENLLKYWGNGVPCNAPFNNMYFSIHGRASPCWKLPGYCDQWSKTRSVSDIWFGEKFQIYRDALKQELFLNKCKECKIEIDNDVWPLARAYKNFPIQQYPSLIELELSNQCNLECIMCNGNLSSGIRKNRDKLPPLPQVYDDSFRLQLHEFIPHLTELRFNGGEPLAQKIVLDICNDVIKINPDLRINIATNGTVYNKRVQYLMDKCNMHFNISIDSLQKERYEQIRINGNYDLLMKNFKIFNKYCKDNNRNLSVMVNPMRNNWDEMIDFGKFCIANNVGLWYNTILYPEHLAIWNLPSTELKTIYETLSDKLKDNRVSDTVDHLVHYQIKNWLLNAYEENR